MNHRSLLARATEGTDAPTPGYLYIDLAKAATGNPATCQDMSEYLRNRLSSRNNPNIKFKCCKVIAKLCDQVPRNAFRRCIAQDHEAITAIKEAMNYRGTMDPVRGDEPNQRVRIAAKEALDAVYREAPSSDPVPTGYGGVGGVPTSYGSSPQSANGSGARRMEGIGNPRYTDPRLDPRYNPDNPTGIKGVVKEAGEIIVGMIKDPLARNIAIPPPSQGHSGNLPGYGGPSYGRPPPGSSELMRQTGGQWTMASNRGPGAINPEHRESASQSWSGNNAALRNGGVGGSWGAPASSQTSHSTPSIIINTVPGSSSGAGGSAVSDGTYERNLVLELCPPGGMKPVPPPDKLANFERVCSTLNSDLICPVLLDCLEEGQPWIIRAKALCVMETCIASGTRLSDGKNPYSDFFHACQDEIVPLVSHPRAPIRDPAKRVLQLLGISFDASITAPSQIAPQVHVEPPNLLDFGDEPSIQPVSSVSTSNPPPPPTEAPPPPPAATPAVPPGGMFGGMQIKNTPAQASPIQATTPQASLLDLDNSAPVTTTFSDTTDFFGELATESSVSTTNGLEHSAPILNQMALKESTDPTPSLNETAGISAFGFINSTASAVSSEDDTTGATPGKTVFDPLKTATPNSASQEKKMMQFSPEQMQAMAYQQMMMQQQFQQMQMAIAMQNQFHPPVMVPMHAPVVPNTNVLHMQQPMRFNGGANGATAGFSFIDAPKLQKQDDKKFDFVKDAMLSAGHKK